MKSKEKKAGGKWSSVGKLVVIGIVAAMCGLAVIFIVRQSVSSVSLLSLQTGYSPEVQQAYHEYLAKFRKQYANRNEITASFENFAKSYEIVKKHNANADRLYDMELDLFSDLSFDQLKNIEHKLDDFTKSDTNPTLSSMKMPTPAPVTTSIPEQETKEIAAVNWRTQ